MKLSDYHGYSFNHAERLTQEPPCHHKLFLYIFLFSDYNSFYSSVAFLLRVALRNITVIKIPLEASAQKAFFRSCNIIIFHNLSLRTLLVTKSEKD